MEGKKSNWGGARAGGGRPTISGKKKFFFLQIRVDEDQKERIKTQAQAEGKSVSQFVLEKLL